MKINKYNKPKNSANLSRVEGGITAFYSGGASNISEASKLLETHLIYGLPFNGTLDVDGDFTTSGTIAADGDITTSGNVIGEKFIGDVDAENIDTTNINADKGNITTIKGDSLTYNNADIKLAIIDALTSVDITTENLTVTKLAHFFELIIDKIKAAGGAVLLTPADGFKVDLVREVNHSPRFYKLYWRATDGEKAISNMWRVGDLAICLTFNNAEVGANYNVSNKYYWSYVDLVGTETIEGVDYHFIEIEGSDTTNNKANYDGVVNPEIGDNIAMLGYRGTDDVNRQSAIYISAYDSLDPTLKAPLFCQYKGINDFDLKSHKFTWFASNGNEIRGNLKIESGLSVSSISSTKVEYAVGTSGTDAPADGWSETIPYTPPSRFLWTRTTISYTDGTETISYSVARFGANGSKGDNGKDGNDGSSYTDNLLRGTLNFEGELWKNLSYWTDAGEQYMGCKVIKREANTYGVYLEFEAIAGESYTFSAYVKSDGDDVRYYFTISGGGVVTPILKDVPESSEWSRLAVTFKCTQSGVIGCRVLKASGTGAIYVAGLKLERGVNDNTSWSLHRDELKGKDADYYKLIPLIEIVEYLKGLRVNLLYLIAHIVGKEITIESANNNLYVRFKEDGTNVYTDLSKNNTPSYTNEDYIDQYGNNRDEDPTYFTIELVQSDSNGISVLERRILPVTYLAKAIIEVKENILATVSSNYRELGALISTNTNNIANLQILANEIASTVESHTTEINNLTNEVTQTKTDVSSLTQQANRIASTVTSLEERVNYDVANKDNWENTALLVGRTTNLPFSEMRTSSSENITFSLLIPYTPTTYILVNSGYDILYAGFDIDKKYLQKWAGWLSYRGNSRKIRPYENCSYFAISIKKEDNSAITPSEIQKAGLIITDTAIASSLIELTANLIKLLVDDISLKLDNKKIVLDGDTEINGSLTMDNTDLGFILKGDSGITLITPLSIGSYSNFASKSVTTIPIAWKRNVSVLNGAELVMMYTYDIGLLNANTAISLKNGVISGFSGVANLKEITYSILKNGVSDKIVQVAFSTNSTILDYTTTESGNYSIRVQFTLVPFANYTVEMNVGLDLILPTGCFSLIGYDGMAMNFGNLKTVYFGSDGAYISYGNNRLKIDSNGIYKYGGEKTVEPQYMNKGEKVDTALSRYVNDYVPLAGCITRNIVSLGTTYLLPNDELILLGAVTGTLTLILPTPSKNVGRRIYIKSTMSGAKNMVSGNMMKSNDLSQMDNLEIKNVSYMFLCDGIHWIIF